MAFDQFRLNPTGRNWSELVGIGRKRSEMVGIFEFRDFVLENHSYKKFLSLLLIHSRASDKSALIYIGSVCNLFIYLVKSIINIDLIAFYLHLEQVNLLNRLNHCTVIVECTNTQKNLLSKETQVS